MDAPAGRMEQEAARSGRRETGDRRKSAGEVSYDWPDVVPISEAELRITEAYLEKVLAELLGPLP